MSTASTPVHAAAFSLRKSSHILVWSSAIEDLLAATNCSFYGDVCATSPSPTSRRPATHPLHPPRPSTPAAPSVAAQLRYFYISIDALTTERSLVWAAALSVHPLLRGGRHPLHLSPPLRLHQALFVAGELPFHFFLSVALTSLCSSAVALSRPGLALEVFPTLRGCPAPPFVASSTSCCPLCRGGACLEL